MGAFKNINEVVKQKRLKKEKKIGAYGKRERERERERI